MEGRIRWRTIMMRGARDPSDRSARKGQPLNSIMFLDAVRAELACLNLCVLEKRLRLLSVFQAFLAQIIFNRGHLYL